MMLDRKEEHLAAGNRPSSFAKIKVGVDEDGKLTAFDAETCGTGGAGRGAGFPLPYIYVFPNRRRQHTRRLRQRRAARAMRAPGHPQGCFLTESLMDDLADKLQDGPARVPAQEPAAEGAERACGGSTFRSAPS